MSDPIDFGDLAAALLERAEQLVPQWLAGGKRSGHEWVCGGLDGESGGSCSVNLVNGRWADFASEERGGDLISLYATIHGLSNGAAARELMQHLGWQKSSSSVPNVQPNAARPAAAAGGDDRPVPPDEDGKRRSMWRPIVPVPPSVDAPKFKHHHYTAADLVCTWEYRFEGQLYGYVARFRKSDGGKEILPYTYCIDESDDRQTQRWHTKQWDEPRPLYVPATLLSGDPQLPVVLVEGEKCALAGHVLLGHEFDFVSWPGGGNAWAKAAWGWLMGRTVYLWPDCDAKRKRLTKAERDAGVDPGTTPLLPEPLQTGMKAMNAIGSLLLADQACSVYMCPMPKPGAVSDGWDIADAIEQGWSAEDVRAFIRGARVFTSPNEAAEAKARAEKPRAADDDASDAWRAKLICSGTGATRPVRENLVLALDGQPSRDIAGIAEAEGVIAFNDFTNDVVKLKPSPWGTPAGVWDEVDELEMGAWLTRDHRLPSMPRGTLEEAVAMVAKRHRFHPVRDALSQLRGKWDGKKRLSTWLSRCCLEEPPTEGTQLHEYLARVGTWLVMAIAARVFTPGCKFDYMVIFEGPQGVGKSTLAKILGGDFFADTGLVLGDKDSYQNLQGVLVYEWGELDSLNRSEVTKVKQFISSAKDRFRASFDRRAKDYPRQVVFVGTTNEDHYLVDPTGNRRMWPVRVTRQVDLQWLRDNRDQLFAEALVYFDAGERFHPTPAEQRALFEPQQLQRQIENAVHAEVMRYLYDEDQPPGHNGLLGTLISEITAQELLARLGIAVEKRTHVLLRQATAALRQAGWVRYRSTRGDRPWMFKRPPPGLDSGPGASDSIRPMTPGGSTSEAPDACPF